jgi:hypothetical protein
MYLGRMVERRPKAALFFDAAPALLHDGAPCDLDDAGAGPRLRRHPRCAAAIDRCSEGVLVFAMVSPVSFAEGA